MKKKILFVDDDLNVLTGLKRMLRPLRQEWEMTLTASGHAALEELSKSPYDVVVSDMHMPVMDGVDLLKAVKEQHPEVVRIILSGHSDDKLVLKSIGCTHQFLAKPCDADKLKATISNALALRNFLNDDKLKKLVSNLDNLPSMPTAYLELTKKLRSPEVTLTEIGTIISKDIGMTAKILQIVNSAFFGLSVHVSSPVQAAKLLGLDTISTLILSVQIFSKFRQTNVNGFSLKKLMQHSMVIGASAKKILVSENQDKDMFNDALMAGILHDLGKLIFLEHMQDQYYETLDLVNKEQITLLEAENQTLGTNHAAVGAYLLGLWGLPDSIVEAVAFHHLPSLCSSRVISPLTAVHVANVEQHEIAVDEAHNPTASLDMEYLDELGLTENLSPWQQICKSIKLPEIEL